LNIPYFFGRKILALSKRVVNQSDTKYVIKHIDKRKREQEAWALLKYCAAPAALAKQ
jgi:hypothetical protein